MPLKGSFDEPSFCALIVMTRTLLSALNSSESRLLSGVKIALSVPFGARRFRTVPATTPAMPPSSVPRTGVRFSVTLATLMTAVAPPPGPARN